MIGWRLALVGGFCLHQSQNIMNGHANTVDDDDPNDTVNIFRPDAVHDSVREDSVGDDKAPLQRDYPVGLPNLMGAIDDPCNLRPDNTTDSMCYAVDVCNRFSLLPIEDPQVMASSAEELPETEKGRSQGGSDHNSDKLELAAEMMMHRSSSQEFNLATSGNKFEKQQKNQGGRCTSTEVHSNNSSGNSLMPNGSSGAKPQTHNQKVAQ